MFFVSSSLKVLNASPIFFRKMAGWVLAAFNLIDQPNVNQSIYERIEKDVRVWQTLVYMLHKYFTEKKKTEKAFVSVD